MLQLPFTGAQASAHLAQRLGLAQMAEQHRDELGPAFKATGVAVGSMFLHRGFKFQPREQLQKLRKNTAYSTHGRKPPFAQIGSSLGTQSKLTALTPFVHKLIWTSLSPLGRYSFISTPRPHSLQSHQTAIDALPAIIHKQTGKYQFLLTGLSRTRPVGIRRVRRHRQPPQANAGRVLRTERIARRRLPSTVAGNFMDQHDIRLARSRDSDQVHRLGFRSQSRDRLRPDRESALHAGSV
jgi:hypothetical protein